MKGTVHHSVGGRRKHEALGVGRQEEHEELGTLSMRSEEQ